MDKNEGRAVLKALQGIVNGRADTDAAKVVDEVRAYVATFPAEREEKESRDRQERKGRTRKEG